jgi:hypothetical protein
VADHPDRTEVIYFFAEDCDEGAIAASLTIIRGPVLVHPTLGPLVFESSDMVSIEGRLTGLLPNKGTQQ